jgi:hypothetical protein
MTAFYIVLAACPVLFLGFVAFLVMVVAGIRKSDRGDIYSPAENRITTITRRVLGGGTRNREEGDD